MVQDGRIGILFVCLGNICRSPMAQAAMERVIEQRGVGEQFRVDSAGTASWHTGRLPEERMRYHALRHGYNLTHKARTLQQNDLVEFDYVLGMDDENMRAIRTTAGGDTVKAHVELMLDFAQTHPPGTPVPDPYYGEATDFEEVIRLCEAACPAVLDRILKETK